ncbi:DUF4158 domain-containing protein [Actinomadura rudentiformis]|uniref:DUF4158 domain-containing protein n=1 Tax=Actinomadura rudentiformis TaxID=359158 RepID=A0A6H9YWK8_9ACTN|nr:DUF4158 domain-containing protein [Actinomadura rudentiformis]
MISVWTLVKADWELIANKAGATQLGFSVMLKFCESEGRFPVYPEEVPQVAVEYVASLVEVDPASFAKYSWRGRTIKYHRAQIRKAYGTRPPTEANEDRCARWLAEEMCPTETSRERLAAALRERCRSEKVEPPTSGEVARVVASGCWWFDAETRTVMILLGGGLSGWWALRRADHCSHLDGRNGQTRRAAESWGRGRRADRRHHRRRLPGLGRPVGMDDHYWSRERGRHCRTRLGRSHLFLPWPRCPRWPGPADVRIFGSGGWQWGQGRIRPRRRRPRRLTLSMMGLCDTK